MLKMLPVAPLLLLVGVTVASAVATIANHTVAIGCPTITVTSRLPTCLPLTEACIEPECAELDLVPVPCACAALGPVPTETVAGCGCRTGCATFSEPVFAHCNATATAPWHKTPCPVVTATVTPRHCHLTCVEPDCIELQHTTVPWGCPQHRPLHTTTVTTCKCHTGCRTTVEPVFQSCPAAPPSRFTKKFSIFHPGHGED